MFTLELLSLIVLIFWMTGSVFYEAGTYFTAGLILFGLVGLATIGVPVVLAFVSANVKILLIGFVIYFIIGGFWSIFKWWRFNVNVKNRYDYLKSKILEAGIQLKQKDILSSLREYFKEDELSLPPRASKMKSKITLWIAAWPMSIVTWVLGDLVVDICNAIYKMLGNIYDKITKSIFGDSKDYEY